jgi:hypothetical protein
LFNYSVKIFNNMIQLMVRKPLAVLYNLPKKEAEEKSKKKVVEKKAEDAEGAMYKLGAGVDACDRETAALFQGEGQRGSPGITW